MISKSSLNDSDRKFADRYPKLNMLLGLFLLLGIAWISWLVLDFLIKRLGDCILWIGDFASHVDVVVMVALITGGVSIVTVVISTVVGKILERRHASRKYLTEKREKPYCDFVSMVYKIMDNARKHNGYNSEQMIKDIMSFSEQITLWGSPSVANKWIDFRMTGMDKKEPKEMLYKLEGIMNCMRKDLGVRKLKKGKLLSFFINDINEKK